MNHHQSEHFKIEIQKELLRAYLRTKWSLFLWVGFSIISITYGFLIGKDLIQYGMTPLSAMSLSIGAGLLIALLMTLGMYVMFLHTQGEKMSANAHLSIEGPFLKIMEGNFIKEDRMVPFQSIVEYAVIESQLMKKFGIQSLQISTSSQNSQSIIEVVGVKNCQQVRDQLVKIHSSLTTK